SGIECVRVWLPIQCPSATARRAIAVAPGARSCSPTTKNVDRSLRSRRTSSTRGVTSCVGPLSKLRVTLRLIGHPRSSVPVTDVQFRGNRRRGERLTPRPRSARRVSKLLLQRLAIHGYGTAGSLQRRRDRDHHHDHGARAEGAAGRRRGGAPRPPPRARKLRPELRLRRHLLEQPPPSAARVRAYH